MEMGTKVATLEAIRGPQQAVNHPHGHQQQALWCSLWSLEHPATEKGLGDQAVKLAPSCQSSPWSPAAGPLMSGASSYRKGTGWQAVKSKEAGLGKNTPGQKQLIPAQARVSHHQQASKNTPGQKQLISMPTPLYNVSFAHQHTLLSILPSF